MVTIVIEKLFFQTSFLTARALELLFNGTSLALYGIDENTNLSPAQGVNFLFVNFVPVLNFWDQNFRRVSLEIRNKRFNGGNFLFNGFGAVVSGLQVGEELTEI